MCMTVCALLSTQILYKQVCKVASANQVFWGEETQRWAQAQLGCVCHEPVQFLSRLLKLDNGPESSVRVTDWGPIEFYNFSSTYFESFRAVIS